MKKLSIDKEYLIVITIAIIVLVPLWLSWLNVSFCGLFWQRDFFCDFTGIFNGTTLQYFENFIFIEGGTGRYSCFGCINPNLALLTAFFIIALFVIFIYKKTKHKKEK